MQQRPPTGKAPLIRWQEVNGLDMAVFCDLYEARIQEFKLDPPPPGWDGVATMQTK